MTKKTKLAQQFVNKYIKDNKELLEDYQELCNNLLMFSMVWGIEIGLIIKNKEKIEGRKYGVGMVEKLFKQD